MSTPVKGWSGKLRIATSEGGLTADEDNITNVSPSIDSAVAEAYQLGSRLPQALLEGNIKLAVTIEKFYIDNTWFNRCYSATTLTEYYVRVYPQGTVSGKPYVTYLGKFGNWRLNTPQAGEVTESMDFTGKAVTVGTVP